MSALIRVVYTPEGGSKREWTIDFEHVPWDITYGTEKATDWPWGVFVERLNNRSIIAVSALLWVLRKRDEPRLLLTSVKPVIGVDVDIEDPDMDDDALAAEFPTPEDVGLPDAEIEAAPKETA